VNSFPSSFLLSEANRETKNHCGRFHFLLVAFRNTKTFKEGKTKWTRLSWEALSKQNIKA